MDGANEEEATKNARNFGDQEEEEMQWPLLVGHCIARERQAQCETDRASRAASRSPCVRATTPAIMRTRAGNYAIWLVAANARVPPCRRVAARVTAVPSSQRERE